jgi:hypothetical protein
MVELRDMPASFIYLVWRAYRQDSVPRPTDTRAANVSITVGLTPQLKLSSAVDVPVPLRGYSPREKRGDARQPDWDMESLVSAQSVAYDPGLKGVALSLYRSTVSVTHSLTADRSVSTAA